LIGRLGSFAFALLCVLAVQQPHSDASPPARTITWDINRQGSFVTALTRDMLGRVWTASEDNGIWVYDPALPAGKQWVQYTAANTNGCLGDDDICSLCCDSLGRIWAGTCRHGVSVFNGAGWKSYDEITGPLGSHVTCLASDPADGSVWGGSEAGLFRYSLKSNTWTYFTRAQGLPSDAIHCLCFGPAGDIFVGTDSCGLAIASHVDGYTTWRTVPGRDNQPPSNAGTGLPSDIVNCVLAIGRTVYVGTLNGLGVSQDNGETWAYLRGLDWKDKAGGLFQRPSGIGSMPNGVLAEDCVESLAADGTGKIWLGYRRSGVHALDEKLTAGIVHKSQKNSDGDYAKCLLPESSGVATGWYLGGLSTPVDFAGPPGFYEASQRQTPDFPAQADRSDLASDTLSGLPQTPTSSSHPGQVFVLDDDWITRGSWLGRHGTYWACLFSMLRPDDYIWGTGSDEVTWQSQCGPNVLPGHGVLKAWCQWLYSADPRVLEMPKPYLDSRVRKGLTDWAKDRRESEVDDGGETYPITHEGPDVYCTVTVPEGLFLLTIYDVNYNGHGNMERYRDYEVRIRQHNPSRELWQKMDFSTSILATARISDFWSGVWKRFMVVGPAVVDVQLARDGSMNTILPAVMLDNCSYAATSSAPATKSTVSSLCMAAWRDPNWYARNERIAFLSALQALAADTGSTPSPGAASEAVTAFRRAGLFSRGEDAAHALGEVTPRDTEMRLRWDGKTASLSGKESVVLGDSEMNPPSP